MRLLKYLLIVIIALVGLGYGIYFFGTKIASEKLVEILSTEFLNSGEMEKIKQTIESNPELKAFLNDAKSVDEADLPFTTKEEATRLMVKKLGIKELQDIQSQVQEGQINKEELLQKIENNFTEEEITALKVIVYKEINN
ncbi:hypothetical protein [Ornithinibacillus bavariensis]|uniref:Phenylalanyl-tRNA synthetase subunit beta n=1 Tax=Ornithinibacillus bavariensis TaxID=545502 RepID=A0A920C5P9_9BACI|nr:hypothetical protein [Ornithinibacillus bavariensis]GIO26965.1 hypothetical protein J43TS3_15760 [Ornithinibacillus bavariensis]